MKIQIKFVKQDFWIGVFWKSHEEYGQGECYRHYKIYICIIPCFPIIIETTHKELI